MRVRSVPTRAPHPGEGTKPKLRGWPCDLLPERQHFPPGRSRHVPSDAETDTQRQPPTAALIYTAVIGYKPLRSGHNLHAAWLGQKGGKRKKRKCRGLEKLHGVRGPPAGLSPTHLVVLPSHLDTHPGIRWGRPWTHEPHSPANIGSLQKRLLSKLLGCMCVCTYTHPEMLDLGQIIPRPELRLYSHQGSFPPAASCP